MKKIFIITFALITFQSNAQVNTGIPADNSTNTIVNISSNSRTDIKGFSVPNYKLTSKTTDYLGDSNANNLRNSLLIFNSDNSNINKGLYFWDTDSWTNIADMSIVNSKLSNLAKIVKFNTSGVAVTYNNGNAVGTPNNNGQHVINELYSARPANYWTDLNFANGTIKTIEIKNSINNNIFKASGTIQAPTGSNKQNGLKGFLGLALFIKSPGDTDFKLKGHKIISANMYTDCMNFQFDVLSSVKNLPTGISEVKVAMEFREIDGTNNITYATSVASRNTANCQSTTLATRKQNFLPSSTMVTELVINTFENPNF